VSSSFNKHILTENAVALPASAVGILLTEGCETMMLARLRIVEPRSRAKQNIVKRQQMYEQVAGTLQDDF
jgi:hypothetical protein